jgi:hypothetical protein
MIAAVGKHPLVWGECVIWGAASVCTAGPQVHDKQAKMKRTRITDLPDTAMQQVVELASKSSTPGLCFLSGGSKGLRLATIAAATGMVVRLHSGHLAAVAQQQQQQQEPPQSTQQQQQQDVLDPLLTCGWPACRDECAAGSGCTCLWTGEKRLLSLARWLQTYAGGVASLCVSYSTVGHARLRQMDQLLPHHAGRAQADAVSAITDSLVKAAAATPAHRAYHVCSSSGSISGGGAGKHVPSLPLQQLRLPAAGSLNSISNTLAVCGGLRQLRLDAALTRSRTLLDYMQLCQGLRSLTQLTALQVADVWADPTEFVIVQDTLDPLFSSCPCSLEVLLVKVRRSTTLRSTSLTHLVHLRQLQLEGDSVEVEHVPGISSQQALEQLTCLTCLETDVCGDDVTGYPQQCALLDLPQLQVFSSASGGGVRRVCLDGLVGNTSCCKLVLPAGIGRCSNMRALTEMTQLTELVVGVLSLCTPAHAWRAAFHALSQLQRLTIPVAQWCGLNAPLRCKCLPQLQQMTLVHVNSTPQGLHNMVHHLRQLKKLQQLTLSGKSGEAVQCITDAVVKVMPTLAVVVTPESQPHLSHSTAR